MRRHRGLVVGVAALIVIAIAGAAYVFAPRAGNAASPSTTSALSIADLQVEPLTTSGTADRPAISPDGNYVVYVENGGGQQSLRVRQVATGSNVEIVPGEPGVGLMGATVTPDGAFVNYVRRVGQQQSPELWQIPFLGGSPHRLLPGIGGRVSFSPDGNQMAFVRASGPGRTELVVASSDGSNERVVAARQMPEQFWAVVLGSSFRPAWSPDGATIATLGVSNRESAGQVAFLDLRTGATLYFDYDTGELWKIGDGRLLKAVHWSPG